MCGRWFLDDQWEQPDFGATNNFENDEFAISIERIAAWSETSMFYRRTPRFQRARRLFAPGTVPGLLAR